MSAAQKQQALERGIRSGTAVSEKKNTGQATAIHLRKVEEDQDSFGGVATVSTELKLAIQQARLAKKLTQKDLAMHIAEKATVINDYESGRAIPNPQIISKLERVLGVRLPRQKK